MPRLRKTEAQRRAERFGEHYRVGKARLQLQEPQIAEAVGLGVSTLRKYKRDPDLFSMGQLVRLGDVLGWSSEDYVDILTTRK